MNDLPPLWQMHQSTGWPRSVGPNEGELMTLDTVIGGCVTYYLESEEGLDERRMEILTTCLADLDALLPELAGEAAEYFVRLQQLGSLLREAQQERKR